MTTLLTKEDKLNVVNQHIKAVDYALYNLELDLIEAEAVASPDADMVSSLNSRISVLESKKSALVAEKTSVEAE